MDPIAAAAGIAGLIGTVIAILVGLSNLVSFSQNQAEKRRARRLKQQEKADPPPPAVTPTAAPSQEPAAPQGQLPAPAEPLAPPTPVPAPAARPIYLPAEPTPLIGREQEVSAIRTLLQRSEVRMVTLVGPPGAGKTRLAIKVAATVVDQFPDGVFFVALSTLREAALVAPTITQSITLANVGLDAHGQPPAETLARQLQDKQVLLVLDNFEQVMPSATLVAGLLAAAPRLEVLVTSREVLHLSGEHEFAVTPLTLPDLTQPSLALLAQSPAVALFEQRAQAVQPNFRLTNENALAVAQLCTLLDGLPLAIELAAARSKLFSPQEMLARLEDRFQWLTSGARDLPAHQRTLQSTLDWSYNLLDADEQLLLRRLGVFVGGCSFTAVERVCRGPGERALPLWEILASLIDKSLLLRTAGAAGEPRFTMLATIREYAHAQLLASEEAGAIRDNHLVFFLQLAVAVAAQPNAMQPTQLAQLEQEHDNLRSALRWTLAQEDARSMARLVEALLPFWDQHGHSREGLQWLAAVAARRRQLPPRAQAALLTDYAGAVATTGDYARAQQIYEDAAALWRTLDDAAGLAWILCLMGGNAQYREEYAQAAALWQEGLDLLQSSANDKTGDKTGDKPGGTSGDKVGGDMEIAWALYGLAGVTLQQGDLDKAAALLAESLALQRGGGAKADPAWTLVRAGQVAQAQGKLDQALAFVQEGVQRHRAMGNPRGTAEGLVVLGRIALAQQRVARAVQLFGAGGKLQAAAGWQMYPKDKQEYDRDVARCRALLGEDQFHTAWSAGQAMTLDQAVDYALAHMYT